MIINNLRELLAAGSVECGDTINFGGYGAAKVNRNYLGFDGSHGTSVDKLFKGIDKRSFASKYYGGYTGSYGEFPEYKDGDYSAAYRIAFGIYSEILKEEGFRKGDNVKFVDCEGEDNITYGRVSLRWARELTKGSEYIVSHVGNQGIKLIGGFIYNPLQFILINKKQEMKKELPENFVINSRDCSHPLWMKYIEWINKAYNLDYKGNCENNYYGVRDKHEYCANENEYSLPEIILEEWDNIVNNNDDNIIIDKPLSRMKKAELYQYIKNIDKGDDKIKLIEEEREKLKKNIEKIEEEKDKIKKEYDNFKNKINKRFDKISSSSIITSSLGDDIKISDDEYKLIKTAFDKRIPMLFEGPSGCGKTTKAKALAGDRLVVIDCNDSLTIENLLGHYVLRGGETVFVDGLLTDAVRNGKTVLLNEINSIPTGLTFLFNGLTELRDGKLGSLSVVTNQEVLEAHEDFRIIGTLNRNYLGTKDFGMSFLSRFISIPMSPMEIEDEVNLLSKRYDVDIIHITFLAELEDQLRKDKNFTYDISTRDLDLVLMLMEGGLSLEVALNNKVYSNLILELDKEIYKKIFDNLKKEYAGK